MTAAKLSWKEIWLMCSTTAQPFSLNNRQGLEITRLRTYLIRWIFSSARTCSWFCNFRQRYNYGSFDLNWHEVWVVRCRVPLRMASIIFLRNMRERSERRENTVSSPWFPLVPKSFPLFSSITEVGSTFLPNLFKSHFTL